MKRDNQTFGETVEKTNPMRHLDRLKIPYEAIYYDGQGLNGWRSQRQTARIPTGYSSP